MNRNIWFLLAFGVVGGAAFPAAVPAPATAESVTPAVAQATVALDPPVLSPGALAPRKEGEDMVMGLASAPVTLIEYASLTCPHCAHFNEATFPQLKSQYIDKGLVRYIFRDFPLDRMALMAAQIARCSGPERYFAFVDVLFRQQTTWTNGKDAPAVTANLKKLARHAPASYPPVSCRFSRKVPYPISALPVP